MSNDLKETLLNKEIESIFLSLIETDKDSLVVPSLNAEGRAMLFNLIIQKYPIKVFNNKTLSTVLVYNLIKSLEISRPLELLAKIFETKTVNINARMQMAKKRGYVSDRAAHRFYDYSEAKSEYIKAMS